MAATLSFLAFLLLCGAVQNCVAARLADYTAKTSTAITSAIKPSLQEENDEHSSAASAAEIDDVLVMGGYDIGFLNTVILYNVSEGHFTESTAMKSKREYFGAAMIGSQIFAVGGQMSGQNAVNIGEAFDISAGTWSAIASMQVKRAHHAVAALDGQLYAIAGWDERRKFISSVERYDPQTGRWAATEALPDARAGLAAATIGNCIYAVGGSTDHAVASGYKLCEGSGQWSAIASMASGRAEHAVATLDGHLYVCGGYPTISSCERYDPANGWTSMRKLPSGRSQFAMAAVNGKIYAFGGVGSWTEVLRYDPRANTWTRLADMPTTRFGHAAVTVPSIN